MTASLGWLGTSQPVQVTSVKVTVRRVSLIT
jgi:hypothetical protein